MPSTRHHSHSASSMRHSILAIILCIFFTAVLYASFSKAEDGKIGLASSQAMDPFLLASSVQHYRSRRLQGERPAQRSLRVSMVHRNALNSPARREFITREEEILDVIKMDEIRVKGLYAPLSIAEGGNGGDVLPPASAPTYSDTGYGDGGDALPPASAPTYSDAGDGDGDNDMAPAPSPDGDSHNDMAPAPSPESYEYFEARVVSGASFPGNVGQYFVELSIGTPPQPFFFIADTGSDLVWVPCLLCSGCNQDAAPVNGSIFVSQNSSTFKPILCSSQECELIPPPPGGGSCSATQPTSCTYGYGYSDTSQTTGVFAYDTVTMGTTSGKAVQITNVAFGCGTNNTGPSITKVGGVIGLGQGPISFTSQVGYMYGNKFSYCFTSFFHSKASSALIFGDDLAGTELKAPMQYTPFLPNPVSETFYYVGIEHVAVDGMTLPLLSDIWSIGKDGSGGAVIDSGTTLSFFVQIAYDNITQALKDRIDYPLAPPTAGLPICYNVSGIAEPLLPQLSIVFQGDAVFKPSPKNYFLSPKDDLRCLGFMPSPASGGPTVLGNLLQQNFHVEYDRLHNRLGFAKAHCS